MLDALFPYNNLLFVLIVIKLKPNSLIYIDAFVTRFRPSRECE